MNQSRKLIERTISMLRDKQSLTPEEQALYMDLTNSLAGDQEPLDLSGNFHAGAKIRIEGVDYMLSEPRIEIDGYSGGKISAKLVI